MNLIIKGKYFEENMHKLYNKKTQSSLTTRLNTSLNYKKKMGKTKTSLFSRPYIKQSSQYCFLTNLNDKEKLKKSRNNEKEDKTNIYFNLIKTYYDENGIKLKPKQIEIFPIDNDIDYPKIIKTKKKKKEKTDKNNTENILNNENKNKTLNNKCLLYLAQIEKGKQKLINKYNLQINNNNAILKRDKNIIKKTPTSYNMNSGDLINNNKKEATNPSPSLSEKSFNIFFQNKSHDYIINDIRNNPIINDIAGNFNNNNKVSDIKKTNVINKNINNKKLFELTNFNEKEYDNNNSNNNIKLFNNKILHHRKIPTTKINDKILTHDLKSYDYYFNNKSIQTEINNNSNSNSTIFHKKKISDSFDDIKRRKNYKEIRNRYLKNYQSYCIPIYNSKYKLAKKKNINNFFFISAEYFKNQNNKALSWTKKDFNMNNNNINFEDTNKIKISPKQLETYFNPNSDFNQQNLIYKTQYLKSPSDNEINEIIDINNITFKKPFKLVKNIKKENYSFNGVTNHLNMYNNNRTIESYISNYNNNKNTSNLIQNLSYNCKQNKSSIINHKKYITNINDNNIPNMIYSYNIKNIKKKFRQDPYNFSYEKIKNLKNINSFKEPKKTRDEIIKKINNKYIINTYNSRNNNKINIDKNSQEKNKKYIIQRFIRLNKINKNINTKNINNNNNINDNKIENNFNKKLISNNNSSQITKTEPSIINYHINIKKIIKNPNENKNININDKQKITIEKEKIGTKKLYVIRKKLKDGIKIFKNKYDIQNKIGIKKEKKDINNDKNHLVGNI